MPHTVEIDASSLTIQDAWSIKEVCEAADGYSVTSMGLEEWTMTLEYNRGADSAAYDFASLVDEIEQMGLVPRHCHGMGNAIADYQVIDLLITR
jgi:hypothetical protein